MAKNIFRVTIPEVDHQGRQRFVNFECDAESVDALAKRLSDGWIIAGEVLFTRKVDDAGLFEVIRRAPFALGRAGVARIELPTVRFVQYEDEAA